MKIKIIALFLCYTTAISAQSIYYESKELHKINIKSLEDLIEIVDSNDHNTLNSILDNFRQFLEDPLRKLSDDKNYHIPYSFLSQLNTIAKDEKDKFIAKTSTNLDTVQKEINEKQVLYADIYSIIQSSQNDSQNIVESPNLKLGIIKKELDSLEIQRASLEESLGKTKLLNVSNINYKEINYLTYNIIPAANSNRMESLQLNMSQSPISFNEAELVAAIGTFLAEQFEENIIYDLFNNKLFQDSDIKTLFPKTNEYLALHKEYRHTTYIDFSLRKAITMDLKYFIKNIFTDPNNYLYTRMKERSEFGYLNLAFTICDKLSNNFHPVELLPLITHHLYTDSQFSNDSAFKKIKRSFLIMNSLQQSLRENPELSGSGVWINFQKMIEFKDPLEKKYFISLVLLKIRDADEELFQTLLNELLTNDKKIDDIMTFTLNFCVTLNQIEKEISILSTTDIKSQLLKYYLSTFELLKSFQQKEVWNEIYIDEDFLERKLKPLLFAYHSIETGDYSTLIYNTSVLFRSLIEQDTINDEKLKNMLNCLNFFIDLVNAKGKDELKQAISKASSGSGGFMRKREKFNVGINSYVGFFAGYEGLSKLDLTEKKRYQPNVGFMAALGIDLGNFGFCEKRFGFFISVFDFGPIASFRLYSDEELPQNLLFKNFISLGGFLHFSPGITSPITFLLGAQWSPELRQVENGLADSWRIGFSVSYDIPIFYFK